MIKVLTIDDEPLARERIREMLSRLGEAASVYEAANGSEAIAMIISEKPDIVFLDIQMPDMTGFQVLETLGEKAVAKIPALIFVTAYEEHALKAFEHCALDYLLKPFDRERFAIAIERAKAKITAPVNSGPSIANLLEQLGRRNDHLEWLTVKKDERILLVKASDIHSIEAYGNYIKIKLHEAQHLVRETINNISIRLDPSSFIRIHRSTMVNVNEIRELQAWRRREYRVVMKSGQTFTLSRGYRESFDSFFRKKAP